MDRKLLHTPEGVRDIYNEECAKKIFIENKIHDILKSYGYRDIQTPTFEFFDIFNKERGSVASKNMYKFFDREGYTLVLRPDMTPSIARSAAKYFSDEEMPIRFCYQGNMFINNHEYQGKLKEFTQLGAELIGDTTSDADGEMVAMVIDSLLKSGLKEFQVEVGQVEFYRGLIDEAKLSDEMEEELRQMIENKNYFGIEELLDKADISDELKNVLMKFPELFGSLERLETAKNLTTNKRAIKAIERLEKLYNILDDYGYSKYVSFDLGMLSQYEYYTGIIFKGYTYGTGDAIVTGGRYDNLLKQFGKDAPAIGFAVIVDRLMSALSRQKIDVPVEYSNTMVLYMPSAQKNAVKLAGILREQGFNTEMIRKRSGKNLEEYLEYCRRSNVNVVFMLEGSSQITYYNVTNEVRKSVTFDEIKEGKI